MMKEKVNWVKWVDLIHSSENTWLDNYAYE